MADKNSGWACTQSVSVIGSNSTSVTVRVICYWQNQGWDYNISNVSAWVYCNGTPVCVADNIRVNNDGNSHATTQMGYHDFVVSRTTSSQNIPFCAKITSNSSYVSGTKWSGDQYVEIDPLPSHTVSYNANGGSGAPGSQTKWYGSILTLSSGRPSRTGYTFQGWATASTGGVSYQPGGQYGADANVTLYAVWKANTYTVSYNANGGSGAPGNQTKTYGVNLTLSTTKPTRTNYNFLGWSTSDSGTVVYAAGATYTNNSAVTLYAVWELAYVKPRLNNFAVQRCTSNGTADESGTYAKVTFDWSTDKTVSSIKIEWQIQNGTTWSSATVTASGMSGSVSQIVGGGGLDAEITYMFKASVSDSGGTTPSSQITLGTIKFPIDVKDKGKGVAIGKVAEKDDVFEVEWDSEFNKSVKAQKVNSYQFGVVGGARWYYVGDFIFDYQGQYAIIDCYLGDGQNGNHTQNTHMKIILKQGAPNSTYPIGITTNFTQNYSDTSRIRVKIAHSATMECKLYIYLAFSWNDLSCIINGSYKTFTPSITTSTEEPVTDKESSYYYNGGFILYENASGSNGSITLSQNVTYFNYLDIYYQDLANNKASYHNKVEPRLGKTTLYYIEPPGTSSGTVTLPVFTRGILISGTTISTNGTSYGFVIINDSYTERTNRFYITKVIGYR